MRLPRAAGSTHLIEHVLQALLSERRALDVLHGAQFPRKPLTLLSRDWPLLLSLQLLQDLGIVSQVDLRTDDQARDSGTVVVDFREPLLLHVLERGGRCDTEANEEDVRLGV